MPLPKDYLDILKERSKKSRIYKKYQMTGLRLAEMLKDEKHKALYIKLAKEHDEERLLEMARKVADKSNVTNKGAYFMRVLFGRESKTKKTRKAKDNMSEILKIDDKRNEKFLRQKTVRFDFKEHPPKEIRALVKSMRELMKDADGVGLSANQIGLPFRLFVAQVPDTQGKPKFYAVFNPEITKLSKETEIIEEGCLSVPETWGPVERRYRLTLTGQDMNGKKLKIKAWDLLARVFQHEVDHLNGELFIDKAQELHKTPSSERRQPAKKD